MLQSPRLEDVLSALGAMSPDDKAATIKLAVEATKHLPWVPNPGGQTMALDNEADELFIGGEPGGGKSIFLLGTAITKHQDSIIFRREYPQIKGLEKEATEILGSRKGYNAQEHIWRIPGTTKVMEFGSVQHETDVERYQGRAHDLKGFDEITHFSRSQYLYLTLWCRSAKPGQRKRIICTGNPPNNPEGLWVIEHWQPWLDPTYYDPALIGELRWPAPMDGDSDKEVFFRTVEEALAHIATLPDPPRDNSTGEILKPRSRTFIPAKLDDNIDLKRSGYAAVLGYAAKGLKGLASGKFEASLPDDEAQVIPTAWIVAAQKRWTNKHPEGAPQGVIGVDVAQGGADETTLAIRYDGWYAPLVTVPGVRTPNPSDVFSLIAKYRRDNAVCVVDCGGGYGGGVCELLDNNAIANVRFKGSNGAQGRSKCRTYGFKNKRAEVWWRFREALDPDQDGGSPVCLPDDPKLRADLAAPRSIKNHGTEIQIEEKEQIKKRIGRSPDMGDAVVQAWSEGNAALAKGLGGKTGFGGRKLDDRPSRANVAYSAQKKYSSRR